MKGNTTYRIWACEYMRLGVSKMEKEREREAVHLI